MSEKNRNRKTYDWMDDFNISVPKRNADLSKLELFEAEKRKYGEHGELEFDPPKKRDLSAMEPWAVEPVHDGMKPYNIQTENQEHHHHHHHHHHEHRKKLSGWKKLKRWLHKKFGKKKNRTH